VEAESAEVMFGAAAVNLQALEQHVIGAASCSWRNSQIPCCWSIASEIRNDPLLAI